MTLKDTTLAALLGLAAFNVSALAAVQLSATSEPLYTPREITPEEIIAAVLDADGTFEVERDDEGKIVSLQASVPAIADPENVLAFIHATGVAPSKLVGDLAQTSVSSTITATGATATSTTVTLTAANANIAAGQPITGVGIPTGTTVAAIAGTALTLSQAATATASGVTLTITVETQVIGLNEWTISWKRKTVDATTTDDDTYESSLPSTASWTVKAKFMFIDGDSSQAQNILSTITTPQGATPWNFFPTIAQGRAVFSGKAYVDGIDFGSGMGKVVGLDVSLKGTGPLITGTQLAPIANPNTVTGQQAEV